MATSLNFAGFLSRKFKIELPFLHFPQYISDIASHQGLKSVVWCGRSPVSWGAAVVTFQVVFMAGQTKLGLFAPLLFPFPEAGSGLPSSSHALKALACAGCPWRQ
jgi:hypothetical protein